MPQKRSKRTSQPTPPRPRAKAPKVEAAAHRGAEEEPAGDVLPVVGIGASAGGLEALEQFLRHVPDAAGWPACSSSTSIRRDKGMMVELLQRATPHARSCRSRIARGSSPNHVYVIPPNKDMSILHGVLHLLRRGHATRAEPADRLLLPLARRGPAGARHRGRSCPGWAPTARSGCGRSRSRRARRSSSRSTSAKFDGMPRSAIDAGLADVVAPRRRAARRRSSPTSSTRRAAPTPARPSRSKDPERPREDLPHPPRARPATTSRSTSAAPSTGGSSGGWGSTRSTGSRTTSGSCARTRRRSSCSSRSC